MNYMTCFRSYWDRSFLLLYKYSLGFLEPLRKALRRSLIHLKLNSNMVLEGSSVLTNLALRVYRPIYCHVTIKHWGNQSPQYGGVIQYQTPLD